MALVAIAAARPDAEASFIMTPMAASFPNGFTYQPTASAGKLLLEPRSAFAFDASAESLHPVLLDLVPRAGPADSTSEPQDAGPKTVLPEPATIALLGIGLLSLAFLRRTRA